jgi:Peptidase family M23
VPPFEREPEPSPISHRTTARGLLLLLLLGLTAGSAAAFPPDPPPGGTVPKAVKVPTAVFPVVGPARYISDFGDPRAQGRHEGNDIMSVRWAPAVAVEAGTVEFNSGGWGCMLNLLGDSGTKYVYIHLNNDLTMKNDNRGKCVAGVAFAKGLKSGQRVEIGQHIAYVGDSGDADGIQPHLHFERHPGGGAATDPFRWLNGLPRLLFTAPLGGSVSLALRGTVVQTSAPETLRLRLTTVKPWPAGPRIAQGGRTVTISVPSTATFETARGYAAVSNLSRLEKGRQVVVWTQSTTSTVLTALGRNLTAERVQLLPAPAKKA